MDTSWLLLSMFILQALLFHLGYIKLRRLIAGYTTISAIKRTALIVVYQSLLGLFLIGSMLAGAILSFIGESARITDWDYLIAVVAYGIFVIVGYLVFVPVARRTIMKTFREDDTSQRTQGPAQT